MLPLANMSADPENEYFSDGITEDIINALAKVPGMQVASRTSSFAFKGKDVDLRQIGDKFGVTSVVSGSLRKVASGCWELEARGFFCGSCSLPRGD